MIVVVIGGTGHIGSYLVPRLAGEGHEVFSISRHTGPLYNKSADWSKVQQLSLDRRALEDHRQFGNEIAKLKPDIVVDLICFSRASAMQLIDALEGRIQHFLHCGTIWVHGRSVNVPTQETAPREPFGEYAEGKVAIEALLLERAESGFPATIIHPGHIVGPEWVPVNPQGHFNPEVFNQLKMGAPVSLPNMGMETLHHVHADDVASVFLQAIAHRGNALGESFHAVSGAAIGLRAYAESIASWFAQSPNLEFLPMAEWLRTLEPEDAENAWQHIFRSQNCSIAKAQQRLNYEPRYSSIEAIQEALENLTTYN